MTQHPDQRRRGFDVLVLGTILGIVATVTTYSFFSQPPTPDPMEELLAPWTEPPATAPSEPDLEARLGTLETDLATALARIDLLYLERDQAWQQTSAWVDSLLQSAPSEPSFRMSHLKNFRAKLEVRQQAESGSMWAGLDDTVMLVYATALAGEEAITELCDTIQNEEMDLPFRAEALQALGYLPSDRTLHLLLNPPPDVAAQASYDPTDSGSLDRFALMTQFLPTETLAPHQAMLYALAATRLNADPADKNAWKLVATLGFDHNDADSMRLLTDQRTVRDFGEDLLQVAWWSGTESSRAYIERVGKSHPSLEIRQKAADILAGWP